MQSRRDIVGHCISPLVNDLVAGVAGIDEVKDVALEVREQGVLEDASPFAKCGTAPSHHAQSCGLSRPASDASA